MKRIASAKELNYFNEKILKWTIENLNYGEEKLDKNKIDFFVFGYFLKKGKLDYGEYFDLDFDKKTKKITFFEIGH